MIKSANLQNFGPLPNGQYHFAAGLNVIVGENGLGKSQLLKLLYTVLKVNAETKELTKTALGNAYADKLKGVFRPDELGRLVKRKQGREKCEIRVQMDAPGRSCAFSFATQAKSAVQVEQPPQQAPLQAPAYIPTRELVTLCGWFTDLYKNYHLPFDETWYDTVSLLGLPSVKGPRELTVKGFLLPLEEAMGGRVAVDAATGRLYLNMPGEGKMEMPLVAEGLRKLAMLARLISSGALLDKGYLFWDEPESNLNPKLIKVVAACIMHLCKQGIQVFIATHSLFLMRELEMLTKEAAFRSIPQRYFALVAGTQEKASSIEQGDDLYGLQTLVLLDEELIQSDRFMAQEG